MTVMVTPCLWYVVGMKLVCPMSKFPQAPFARAPFGECRCNFGPDSILKKKKSAVVLVAGPLLAFNPEKVVGACANAGLAHQEKVVKVRTLCAPILSKIRRQVKAKYKRRDPSPNLIRGARKSLVQKQQKESITWCGGLLFSPGPPRHLMIIFTREFGREFVYPQLHHAMDFLFPAKYKRTCQPVFETVCLIDFSKEVNHVQAMDPLRSKGGKARGGPTKSVIKCLQVSYDDFLIKVYAATSNCKFG